MVRSLCRSQQSLGQVQTDGLGPTLDTVRSKLNQPLPVGYGNAGTVVEVGAGGQEIAGTKSWAEGPKLVSSAETR